MSLRSLDDAAHDYKPSATSGEIDSDARSVVVPQFPQIHGFRLWTLQQRRQRVQMLWICFALGHEVVDNRPSPWRQRRLETLAEGDLVDVLGVESGL